MIDRPASGTYDDYAEAYAASVASREQAGEDPMGILPVLLALLGDLAGRRALDAGCGEGYLARVMARRGAHVTGADISPRLIRVARDKDPGGSIDYRVADLSRPCPDLDGRFDVVGSYLALNDVADYRGFITTVARALRSGGRAVLSLNNPYAYVVRKGLANYFATATMHLSGLAAAGIHVHFYHRTLPEYLDAFLEAGLHLTRLVDVDLPRIAAKRAAGELVTEGEQLPYFVVLAFRKP